MSETEGRATGWRGLVTLATTAAVLVVGAACGRGDAEPSLTAETRLAKAVPSPFGGSARQAPRTFVGQVPGSNLYVAVVADGGDGLAFFCDGERTWGLLEGEVENGQLRLEGKDASLEGQLEGPDGAARLRLGGASHEVRLSPAIEGTSGLYRLRGEGAVTWWIQTPAGLTGATAEGGSTKGFQTADAQGFETNTAAGGAGGGGRRRR